MLRVVLGSFLSGLWVGGLCVSLVVYIYEQREKRFLKPKPWTKDDGKVDDNYFKQIHNLYFSDLFKTIMKCEGQPFHLPETSFMFMIRNHSLYFIDDAKDAISKFFIDRDKMYPVKYETRDDFESSYQNDMTRHKQLYMIHLLMEAGLLVHSQGHRNFFQQQHEEEEEEVNGEEAVLAVVG